MPTHGRRSGAVGARGLARSRAPHFGSRYAAAMRLSIAALSILLIGSTAVLAAEGREEKVRGDRKRVEAQGFWIYNDLTKGLAQAGASGKPLAVALRCIPCEDCVKLDDDLVDQDPRLRPLLEKFVRVRLVSTNGLDLSLFQFDTDQSFAIFLLRADGTVYGRFGTRSDHKEWIDDVSIEGLAKALEGALALHESFPRDKAALSMKRGPAPTFARPELYPSLAAKYKSTIDEAGKIVPSCIHCHMIGEAERTYRLEKGGAISEQTLLPFPHPKAIGLILDPKERAKVLRVEPGSAAERAGLKSGDAIKELGRQPLLSIADVQWVLHHADAKGASIDAVVERGTETLKLTLTLADGWRRRDDISWRASTWGLRRTALGGILLKPLADDDPARAKLPKKSIGLKIAHLGQNPPHDVAKRAGFRKDDIFLAFDGRTDLPRETDVLLYALSKRPIPKKLAVRVLRKKSLNVCA